MASLAWYSSPSDHASASSAAHSASALALKAFRSSSNSKIRGCVHVSCRLANTLIRDPVLEFRLSSARKERASEESGTATLVHTNLHRFTQIYTGLSNLNQGYTSLHTYTQKQRLGSHRYTLIYRSLCRITQGHLRSHTGR